MIESRRNTAGGPGKGVSNELFGMVLFLVAEVMFFAALSSTYVVSRLSAATWRPAGISLVTPLGVTNSLLLLASGLSMFLAWRAIRRDDPGGLKTYLFLTTLLGLTFVGVQVYEFLRLREAVPFGGNLFQSVFWTFIAIHAAHVLGGVIFLAVVLVNACRGKYHQYRSTPVLLASLYWYLVVVVWIFLFFALYII